MEYKTVGEHKYFNSCRFCRSSNIEAVLDLGLQPLAGGFIKQKKGAEILEKVYPLQINFCKDCYLMQVNSSINPDILFKNYFYVSSSIKTLVEHFDSIANELTEYFPDPSNRFIVEIGANDGTFIKALQDNGFRALGIDPSTNIVMPQVKKGVPLINDYFSHKLAKSIAIKHGRADAIFGFHSLAHIENMHDVIEGIKDLLKKDGFLAMEVHYLGDLIRDLQYDMIYHEHQFYYSLLSLRNFLKQYKMEVFDIRRFDVRAGSIMFYIQNTGGKRKISKNISDLNTQEKIDKLNKIETYKKFSKKIILSKTQLLKLLKELKRHNKKIVGYGASGRGTIIANFCGLKNFLDYVVDDAPAKRGMLLPGTHHRIYQSSKIYKDHIDYALLFAWPFFKEVKTRNPNFRGKFIVPLPRVRIL